MAEGTSEGGVKIAVISAVTAVLTAGITAFTTLQTTNRKADDAVETATAKAQEALQSAQEAVRSANEAAKQAADAVSAVSGTRCPLALTRANQSAMRTYADLVATGAPAATRELLSATGPGCLVTGSVLGYYFKSSANGDNYTVTIDVDGTAFAYPPKDGTQPAVAYAQDDGGQNTAVLVLPPIAFARSLRITYWYPGNERQLSAYAVVASQ